MGGVSLHTLFYAPNKVANGVCNILFKFTHFYSSLLYLKLSAIRKRRRSGAYYKTYVVLIAVVRLLEKCYDKKLPGRPLTTFTLCGRRPVNKKKYLLSIFL